MHQTERVTRIVAQPGRGLLAATTHGRLHRYDTDLNLVRSSHSGTVAQQPSGVPVYAVLVTDDWIVTRDKLGTICRWDAETLRLVDRLDATATCDPSQLMEGEQPSPTILRGIGLWKGKIYVDNGYFQLVVLDLETFTVERVVLWPHGYDMLEWFCTDAPGVHAISDRNGRVHLGSLEDLSFPTVVEIDSSNVHRLVYDRRHRRFWATTDGGFGEDRNIRNGVCVLGLDGEVQHRLNFAVNDVEGLVFSPDFTTAYSGGFDNELLIIDNTAPEPRITSRVGGFSHQIIDIALDDDGALHVLGQDGEIVKLAPDGTYLTRLDYERQCVWDVQPLPGDSRDLLVATDDGTAVVRLEEHVAGLPALRLVEQRPSGFGFTRRVLPTGDGWVGIAWDRTVLRAAGGETLWSVELPGIVHTLSVSPDGERVLVACNAGGLELDMATGTELSRIDGLPASAWATAYLPDGSRLLGTRNGQLAAYDPAGEPTWTVDLGGYPKRLDVDGGVVRVSGAGGIKEYVPGEDKPARVFSEFLDNTVENHTVIDGVLCAVTYGMQVGAYDHETGELLALVEDLPDFAKGIASLRDAAGRPLVVVGGRGGWLRLFRLDRGRPEQVLTPVRDLWLPGAVAPAWSG
ncbi:WD40 repeat domain-containing protein [Streptomyces sp. NPDC049577]|uniref:WD40 repeat domain-containing protein n=1 Tax=Streptomyces sp. NPDC049577 TaxID=3155153 RepID=UPI00343A6A2A